MPISRPPGRTAIAVIRCSSPPLAKRLRCNSDCRRRPRLDAVRPAVLAFARPQPASATGAPPRPLLQHRVLHAAVRRTDRPGALLEDRQREAVDDAGVRGGMDLLACAVRLDARER